MAIASPFAIAFAPARILPRLRLLVCMRERGWRIFALAIIACLMAGQSLAMGCAPRMNGDGPVVLCRADGSMLVLDTGDTLPMDGGHECCLHCLSGSAPAALAGPEPQTLSPPGLTGARRMTPAPHETTRERGANLPYHARAPPRPLLHSDDLPCGPVTSAG